MSANPFFSSTQVAASVPFDNVISPSFASTDVQAAIKEIRDQTVFNSATQVTTAAGTRTLTVTDLYTQFFTGTAVGYTIKLPDATLFPGNAPPNSAYFQLFNTTNQTIQIKDGSGANLFVLGQNSLGFLWLQASPNAAGNWVYSQTSVSTANGLVNYNVISSTAFATSSATDVVITGFTVTPQAGTYAVFYSGSVLQTSSPVVIAWTIYKGGSAVTDSARNQQSARANQTMFENTQTIIQVDGSTAVDVRVKTAGGSLTVNERSLLLIRLGT
jgi:hypothetical protein